MWQEIRKLVKACLPDFVLRARSTFLNAKRFRELEGVTPREVFTRVYEDGVWGRSGDPADRYFSGTGSRAQAFVATYVRAVEQYLQRHQTKPDVVDLGCGDFTVGSQLRIFCGKYVACDVVESLISRNREKFRDLDVDFRVMDLTSDELPDGDVVFLKQVLQHLTNKQIARVLPRLEKHYQHLVLTEHLPASRDFRPNLDMPMGAEIRLGIGKKGSGIVITEPPFSFKAKNETILCEVEEDGGIIRTTAYELA